jgi:hypothetical protein
MASWKDYYRKQIKELSTLPQLFLFHAVEI